MRNPTLPITDRPLPDDANAWEHQRDYLLRAGENSLRTENTYRSGLRLFADWVQDSRKTTYEMDDGWPLSPDRLDNDTIVDFRQWLVRNRSAGTVTTYTAAVLGYLIFLEERDKLPAAIQIGKLQRQLRKRRRGNSAAETVVDLDQARQDIPKIVTYYEQLPLPPQDDPYNRHLSLLRDRALVNVLYSTAARISEVVSLNRSKVGHGRAKHALVTGKGNKTRTIHLQEYARRAIRVYLDQRTDTNPALFVSHSRNANGSRLTITSVHNVVKKAVKALSLHPSLSAHDFRHYRATQLLRDGMPIEVVQEFLGHADIATTRNIYAPVLGIHVVGEWLENMDRPPGATREE